jgi:hypothetical protein
LSGLLVSCGSNDNGDELELALAVNCERIKSNLDALGDEPRVFKRSKRLGASSVPVLLGDDTRDTAEALIVEKFPELDQLIAGRGREGSEQYSDDAHFSGLIFLIAESLKGTDIELPYTREEMFLIARDKAGWVEHVYPLASKTFGDLSGNFSGWHLSFEDKVEEKVFALEDCAVVDEEFGVVDLEDTLGDAFSRAAEVYIRFTEFLQVIRDCKVSGSYQVDECAKEDYVRSPSGGQVDYAPSDEKTPEELEILEERKREAQNEKEEESNSSEERGVRPLQLCYTAFVAVPTEKYGDLTCRPVLVNRIRTLMWMK